MPTDTFAIAAAGDDESGGRYSNVSWADLGSGGGTDEDGAGNTSLYASKKFVFGGRWQVDCIHLRFDTSSIADGATITAANLLIVPVDVSNDADDVEYAADFYDFGGAPTVAGDWERVSNGNAIASIDPDSLSTLSVNSIALTGLSGISKVGYTGIRIAPVDTTEPTGDNYIEIIGYENVSFQEPRLEVTYTVGGVDATVTMTGIEAAGTAAVVAPPRPRPAHPYSEVNLRM